MRTILVPGSAQTLVNGFNNLDDGVGVATAQSKQIAFRRGSNGNYSAIAIDADHIDSWTSAVNDGDSVVGFYVDSNFANHGFLSRP